MKVDHRFDGVRDKPLRFARFWLLQAVAVAVIMLPTSYLLDRSDAPGFGAWAIAGAFVWFVGLLIEAAADAQKSAFKANDANRDRFVTIGLGATRATPTTSARSSSGGGCSCTPSRFSTEARSPSLHGPVFITLLLLFVSGILRSSEAPTRSTATTRRTASTSDGRASSSRCRRGNSRPTDRD